MAPRQMRDTFSPVEPSLTYCIDYEMYSGLGEFLALFFENRFAAEFDFVAFERQDLDQNLVAFLQLIAHLLDPVFRNLADVQQPVGAGEDLDKRAEIHDPDHFPEIGLAHLGHGRDIGDTLDGLVGGFAVGGENVHRAIVLDVDLDAGFIHDAADHLAARPDQIANLIGRDGQRVDARS